MNDYVNGYTTGGTHRNALHMYFQCIPLIDTLAVFCSTKLQTPTESCFVTQAQAALLTISLKYLSKSQQGVIVFCNINNY